MSRSLLGKWKLIRDGSDFLPGLDNLSDLPLVTKLLGNNDIEFFKIEKRMYIDVEEVLFTYTSKSSSISRSYQLGTINFEHVHGGDVILASVQNCVDSFNELIISRLGPKTGQNSREHYQLDPAKDVVKLNIDITTSEGTVIKLIKFLTRFDNSTSENIRFSLAQRTNGWRLHDYWPSTVISNIAVKIVKAVKIRSLNTATGENTHVLEEIWNCGEAVTEEIEWNTISRCFSGKSHENDEFVEFVIKVQLDGLTWLVARRYNEFDALRHFLMTQNPHNTEFQHANGRFPGKALVFRKSVLDVRLRGLEDFLCFYLANARYCRQNALDALCFFLQVPEHSFFKSKGAVQTNSRGISTILPSQTGSTPSTPTAMSVAAKTSDVQQFGKLTAANLEAGKTFASSPTVENKAILVPSTSKNEAIMATTSIDVKSTSSSTINPPKSGFVEAPPKKIPHVTESVPSQTVAPSSSSPNAVSSQSLRFNDDQDGSDDGLLPAQRKLLQVLGDGMHVIKHGRQGAPKQRLLRCNRSATELFIQADDHRKTLKLADVESIRLGTEIDPITSPEALRSVNNDTSSDAGKKSNVMRRASLSFRGIGDSTVYYGTATLRRTCKIDDLKLCLSLIMPDRTFDIQCKTIQDLEMLYHVLQDVCGKK